MPTHPPTHTPAKPALFFDGHCHICTRSARVFRAIDWLDNIDIKDAATTPPEELPAVPPGTPDGIPLRTPDGRTLVGLPALRHALLRTPLGFLPALALHLPLVSHTATLAYNAFAKRRPRNACTVTDPQPPR